MTKLFRCELIKPHKIFFQEFVECITFPGNNGYMTVMYGHSKMIIKNVPGIVKIKVSQKKTKSFMVFNGISNIEFDVFSLLSETIIPIKDFHVKIINEKINHTLRDFNDIKKISTKNKIEDYLYQLINIKKYCSSLE